MKIMSKDTPATPAGYNTINPFIVTEEASDVIIFLKEVFDAVEVPDALTYDTDGLILHSEIKIGDSIVQIADRKKDWPFTPSLLQVYVSDVDDTLKRAKTREATIITKTTDFLGSKFSRFKDKWHNLWWVYEYTGKVSWDEAGTETNGTWEPTEEATYIRDTLIKAMRNLDKD